MDQPHSIKRGSSVHYYATELPGNVVGLIDSQKGLANEYRYTPWGESQGVQETVPNSLRFQAREWDEGTGMYYFRNRWYDPQLLRFNSEDPIGLEGGINLYAFTENNPVNFRDPWGLAAECVDFGKATAAEQKAVSEGNAKYCPLSLPPVSGGGTTGGTKSCRGACPAGPARPGGSERGPGGKGPSGASPAEPKYSEGQCVLAGTLAAGQLVADGLIVTGVFSWAGGSFRAAIFMGSSQYLARSPTVMGSGLGMVHLEQAVVARAGAQGALQGAVGTYAGENSIEAAVRTSMVQEAAGMGGFTWKNMVPGFATWEAIKQAAEVCGNT